MKFTDRYVKNLKVQDKEYEVGEGNGLYIRVWPSGKKSWIFRYKMGRKNKTMTLGRYPNMSVAMAHSEFSKARTDWENGLDPGAIKTQANQEERKAPTVTELVDDFIEFHAKRYRKTWNEDQRILKKDVIPTLGDRKAKDVTRREVIKLLDEVVARGAPIQANRLKSLLTTMFNFAVDRAILDISPCMNIKPLVPEKERERALTEVEIQSLWNGLNQASMDELTKLVLKFQLATGQRSGEIVSAEWSEIDVREQTWIIPSYKTKNGNTHVVPLSPFALDPLDQIKMLSAGSPWLFPAHRGAGHRTRAAISRAIRRNDSVFDINHFTPHDLRRTVRTQLGKMGIPPHIAEKVINHADEKIMKTYDRYSYDAEKRQALDAWGRKLEAIITDQSNVVELKQGIGLS